MSISWNTMWLGDLVPRALGVKLSKDEEHIVARRLGWIERKQLTQAQVGQELRISQPAVSNIERSLESRLRRELRERQEELAVLYKVLAPMVQRIGLTVDEIRAAAEEDTSSGHFRAH
jgi:predicted XRE-type DNA-binding protein